MQLGQFWLNLCMAHFCWGAQIRVEQSDWSNIEKVRKKFIMKNFLTFLVPLGFLFPIKSWPYKGSIRIIVLAAILHVANWFSARPKTRILRSVTRQRRVPLTRANTSRAVRTAATTRVWKLLTSSASPLWGVLSWKMLSRASETSWLMCYSPSQDSHARSIQPYVCILVKKNVIIKNCYLSVTLERKQVECCCFLQR